MPHNTGWDEEEDDDDDDVAVVDRSIEFKESETGLNWFKLS